MSDERTQPRLYLLLEASRRLNRALELDRLLAEVRDLITSALEAEACSLLLYDEERTRLEFYLAYNHVQPEPHDVSLAPGEGMGGWIAEHDSPVLSNDAPSDPRFRHVIDRQLGWQTRNFLGIPVHRGDSVIGVLEVLNKKRPEGFTEDDLELLRALGDQIAFALENALLFRRAERRRAESEALLKIGLVLNQKLELDDILATLLDLVKDVVPYEAGAIYLLRRNDPELEWFAHRGYPPGTEERVRLKLGQGAVGWVAKSGEALVIPDVRGETRYVEARPSTRSEAVVPIVSESRLIGVLNLEADRVHAFHASDLGVLTTFASQAAISIQRAHLYEELKVKQRLENELKIARSIQESFLPAKDPILRGYDLSGINLPSKEVSGDYYDYLEISPGQIGLMLGDVSGKGMPAALIMASLRASLRAEIRNRYAISEILTKVNDLLWESIEPGQFVTLVYGVLDQGAGLFTYSNAGHNPPVRIRIDGSTQALEEGGLILGSFRGQIYREEVIQLARGDILLFYTDGLTEAENSDSEPFGPERLVESVRKLRHLPAREICRQVVAEVRSYSGETDGADDMTLVILRVL